MNLRMNAVSLGLLLVISSFALAAEDIVIYRDGLLQDAILDTSFSKEASTLTTTAAEPFEGDSALVWHRNVSDVNLWFKFVSDQWPAGLNLSEGKALVFWVKAPRGTPGFQVWLEGMERNMHTNHIYLDCAFEEVPLIGFNGQWQRMVIPFEMLMADEPTVTSYDPNNEFQKRKQGLDWAHIRQLRISSPEGVTEGFPNDVLFDRIVVSTKSLEEIFAEGVTTAQTMTTVKTGPKEVQLTLGESVDLTPLCSLVVQKKKAGLYDEAISTLESIRSKGNLEGLEMWVWRQIVDCRVKHALLTDKENRQSHAMTQFQQVVDLCQDVLTNHQQGLEAEWALKTISKYYLFMGKPDLARQEYDKYLANMAGRSYEKAEAVFELANLYRDSGNFELATREYNRVIADNPDDLRNLGQARLGLARCYLRMAKYDQAVEQCKAILNDSRFDEGHPNMRAAARLGLGLCYSRMGQKELAKAELDLVVATAPKYSPLYNQASFVLRIIESQPATEP